MAHDLSAAEAHEPVTRPPVSYPLQDRPRTRPAIRLAKHDGPSAGCGQLRAASAYSRARARPASPVADGMRPPPSAEVTAAAAVAGRIGKGPGWPRLVTVRLLWQLGASGEARSLPGRA